MIDFENKICYNGFFTNGDFANAHLYYNGMSVIVDYEHCLHYYDEIPDNTVPVEILLANNDIEVIYVKLGDSYPKVDLDDLMSKLKNL